MLPNKSPTAPAATPVAPPSGALPTATPLCASLTELQNVALIAVDTVSASPEDEARKDLALQVISNYPELLFDILSWVMHRDGPSALQLLPHVNHFLCELAVRLLGHSASEKMTQVLDPSTPRQIAAWKTVAAFLTERIESLRMLQLDANSSALLGESLTQMSSEATAWESVLSLLDVSELPGPADTGATQTYGQVDRREAAQCLILRFVEILRDLTDASNPNVDVLVAVEDRRYVEQFLQELVASLLGRRAQPESIEPNENFKAQRKAAAWVATAKYLLMCLDGASELSLNMSPGAAAATTTMAGDLVRVASHLPSQCTHRTVERRCKRKISDISSVFSNDEDALVLTEAQPPYKIVHVNKAWCDMCGYSSEEVEGMTNGILHGPNTDKDVTAHLMERIRVAESVTATVVNYKKGGVPFVNQVQVEPVFADNKLCFFAAILQEMDTTVLV
mmetsp:Transcript_36184/g.88038  ORF Transcript_36184/g.88038 Transcript_36184/m.88038 type:complete len:451 (-) Transcript_36184:473-1825(-)